MKHRIFLAHLLLSLSMGVLAGCDGSTIVQLPAAFPRNFHAIEDGRAYRSAQPTARELTTVIESYGIRTVINLRGENTGDEWYDQEAATCEAVDVTLLNFPMSARYLPSPDLLEQITQALQTAEYPILIHCRDGADRSGAISAIYRILINGEDKSAAMSELSPAYLHFRQFMPCMDTLVEHYEPAPEWLAHYADTWNEIVCTP